MAISRIDTFDTMRLTVALTRASIFSKIDELADREQVVCLEDKKVYIKINNELYSTQLQKEVE